jgi:FkbM family methyltransferase
MIKWKKMKQQPRFWLRKYPLAYRITIYALHYMHHPWGVTKGFALMLTRRSGHLRVGGNIMEIPYDWWSAFEDGDYYEKNVSYWIERLLSGSRSRVFYDIGANYGYYCLKLASKASHIYAFEPVARTYHTLVRNVQRNNLKNVTPYRLGLSDKSLSTEINIYSTSGYNSLFLIDYPSVTGQHEVLVGKEAISLVTLDELIQDQSLNPPDLIKMDIEGGELFALKGARKTIETYQPILLLEFNPRTYKAAGYTTSDVSAELEEHDYQIYGISEDARDFNVYRPISFDDIEIANIIAVPKSMEGLLCDASLPF